MGIRCILAFLVGLFGFNTTDKQIKYSKIECSIRPIIRRVKHNPQPCIPYTKVNDNQKEMEVSTNWSGYVAAKNNLSDGKSYSVSSVYGSWVVPTITKTNYDAYCAIWVGIDGYGSPSVEQIGTSHDWLNSKQVNYAWFEMYPELPQEIVGFPVNVGDSISASVEYKDQGKFQMKIVNNTKKVYTEVPVQNTIFKDAERKCAEWIVEAPFSNGVLPLSNFSTINMSDCTCKIDNYLDAIGSNTWLNNGIVLIDTDGVPKSIPTQLNNDKKSFSVKWVNS